MLIFNRTSGKAWRYADFAPVTLQALATTLKAQLYVTDEKAGPLKAFTAQALSLGEILDRPGNLLLLDAESGIASPGSLSLIDRDADGATNDADACPSDSAKTEPGVCGCNAADADRDEDGALNCLDCNPNDAAVHPQAAELCNGRDDDCDGLTDADDSSLEACEDDDLCTETHGCVEGRSWGRLRSHALVLRPANGRACAGPPPASASTYRSSTARSATTAMHAPQQTVASRALARAVRRPSAPSATNATRQALAIPRREHAHTRPNPTAPRATMAMRARRSIAAQPGNASRAARRSLSGTLVVLPSQTQQRHRILRPGPGHSARRCARGPRLRCQENSVAVRRSPARRHGRCEHASPRSPPSLSRLPRVRRSTCRDAISASSTDSASSGWIRCARTR